MAKPQIKTHRTNRFLVCFGISGNKSSHKNPIKTRSKNKLLSLTLSMFCFSSKKSRTKTVAPIENSEKGDFSFEGKATSKPIKKKSDSKPQSPSNYNKPSRQNSKVGRQISSLDKASRAKPKEGPEPNLLIGKRKLLDPTRTHTKLSHSVSLSVLQGNQRVKNSEINGRVNTTQHKRRNNGVVEKFGPVMGLSIIMVTLVIILLWGRLCAILCTSAWFYVWSSFRTTAINSNDIESIPDLKDSDLNSEEYKKKVVLEGLLERNRKVTL